MTRENAAVVVRAMPADGVRAVARIATFSAGGRAPKNDPAAFALAQAAAADDLATRRAALAVARTKTHLFKIADLVP